jgi:ubiquinone/menaquinone biosynthesis C-methylase UbiE
MLLDVENTVRERYTEGARERQEALCCPVSYDADLLALLPQEIIDKDYGCGDPSRYVQQGDHVLDLGSGGGKICYMAAQLVGDSGRVTGVDMNDDMLALARRHQDEMAVRLGGDRVRFLKGHIQDLALDIDALADYLGTRPVSSPDEYAALRAWESGQRRTQPLIPDQSVDLVISNCVLNLVADQDKQQLISEIYRVLKPGGRIAISDIISDQPVPAAMKNNHELWSGCISGAYHEAGFLDEFSRAGFHAVCYDKWDPEPWQIVEGIEFRSVTLTAVKPEEADDTLRDRSVIYRGPFAAVTDDTGQHYTRGHRVPVTARTLALLHIPAYRDAFIDPETSAAATGGSCGGSSIEGAGASGSSHGGCCG